MIHANIHHRKGFTLVELMLAMAFVSALLLAIAMTTIQAGNTYNKGMALKDINQSARAVSDDLRRTVSEAGAVSLSENDYVVTASTDPAESGRVLSGRLCLGNYSYLWNTTDGMERSDAIKGVDGSPLTLVKVPDASKAYCARAATTNALIAGIREEDASSAVTLVKAGDHLLTVTSFSADTEKTLFDPATGQRLFSIEYGIGTGRPSSMNEDRTACLVPGDEGADPIYCNVQHFSTVVRTGGGA